jgi:hypothetical protein
MKAIHFLHVDHNLILNVVSFHIKAPIFAQTEINETNKSTKSALIFELNVCSS